MATAAVRCSVPLRPAMACTARRAVPLAVPPTAPQCCAVLQRALVKAAPGAWRLCPSARVAVCSGCPHWQGSMNGCIRPVGLCHAAACATRPLTARAVLGGLSGGPARGHRQASHATHLLSMRSVLLPTRKMMTSLPRSARTSWIQRAVLRNDCRSAVQAGRGACTCMRHQQWREWGGALAPAWWGE